MADAPQLHGPIHTRGSQELVLAATVQPADHGDTTTLCDSLMQAQMNMQAAGSKAEIKNTAADKGYHGAAELATLEALGFRSYVPERESKHAVYQTERYGNFIYQVGGLTPGATYTVRLHFAEIYWNSAGARTFNVKINGSQALTNFDIFATAGGMNKAIARDFVTTANSSGQIVLEFVSVVNYAKLSGLEIY